MIRNPIGMIGKSEFSLMQSGVVILNTARGGIIKEKSLLEALKSGKVAAAGIDTWEVEPPKENPFRDFPQVVMSPHVGASTKEAQQRIAVSVATQIPRALRGEVVDYPVNMPRVKVLSKSPVSSYISLAEKLGLFSSQYIEFTPIHLVISYRGKLSKHDATLLRLCFLKGLLQNRVEKTAAKRPPVAPCDWSSARRTIDDHRGSESAKTHRLPAPRPK